MRRRYKEIAILQSMAVLSILVSGCVSGFHSTIEPYDDSLDYKVKVVSDECNIVDIVRKYVATSQKKHIKLNSWWEHFSRHEHAMYRVVFRNRDYHLLEYIIRDPQYVQTSACSTVLANHAYAGVLRERGKEGKREREF